MNLLLETPRLVLRPLEENDAAMLSAYRSDPEVARYQTWETPYPIEQAFEFIRALRGAQPGKPGVWFQLAITLKDSGEMTGDCGFYCLSEDERQAEIGFTLAASGQGKGYATEAVGRLVDYLFDTLGLYRVRANVDPDNHPSARLLRRLGFRFEGRWIESMWLKGAWVSEDWYALLRREWIERMGKTV
jgi:aminoglycoside 6'-N-acetyltransferase